MKKTKPHQFGPIPFVKVLSLLGLTLLGYSLPAAADNYLTGYRISSSSSLTVYLADGTSYNVTNSSGTRAYFIPTKTSAEWTAFAAHVPSDLTITSSYAPSCKAIHDSGVSADGAYTIDPDGPGGNAPFSVYCDMTTAGGGWMLIGRSVSSGGGSFGWATTAGSFSDDSNPYSMGSKSTAINPTQVLIGSYSSGKSWTALTYIQTLPANITSNYSGSSICYSPASPVTGSGTTNFVMSNCVGLTYHTDIFYFRDNGGDVSFGLGPNGWNLYFSTGDPNSGYLQNAQGMIMVR